MIKVFIVVKGGADWYYLLKVVRRGFDVYCFLPDLGVHHSLHESGEAHFRSEGKVAKPRKESPVALIMGEAGTPIKKWHQKCISAWVRSCFLYLHCDLFD